MQLFVQFNLREQTSISRPWQVNTIMQAVIRQTAM